MNQGISRLTTLLQFVQNSKRYGPDKSFDINIWIEMYDLLKTDIPKDVRFDTYPFYLSILNMYQHILLNPESFSDVLRPMYLVCRLLLSPRFETLFCPSVDRTVEFLDKLLTISLSNIHLLKSLGPDYSQYVLMLLKNVLLYTQSKMTEFNVVKKSFTVVMDQLFNNLVFLRGLLVLETQNLSSSTNQHIDTSVKLLNFKSTICVEVVETIDLFTHTFIFHDEVVSDLAISIEQMIRSILFSSSSNMEVTEMVDILKTNPELTYMKILEDLPKWISEWENFSNRKGHSASKEGSSVFNYPVRLFSALSDGTKVDTSVDPSVVDSTPSNVINNTISKCPREFMLQWLSVGLHSFVTTLRKVRLNHKSQVNTSDEDEMKSVIRRKRALLLQSYDEFTCTVIMCYFAGTIRSLSTESTQHTQHTKKSKKVKDVENNKSNNHSEPIVDATIYVPSIQALSQILRVCVVDDIYNPNQDFDLAQFTFFSSLADTVDQAVSACLPNPPSVSSTVESSTRINPCLTQLIQLLPTSLSSIKCSLFQHITYTYSQLLFLSPELVSARIQFVWNAMTIADYTLSLFLNSDSFSSSIYTSGTNSLLSLGNNLVDVFSKLRQLPMIVSSYVVAITNKMVFDEGDSVDQLLTRHSSTMTLPLLLPKDQLIDYLKHLTQTQLLSLWTTLNTSMNTVITSHKNLLGVIVKEKKQKNILRLLDMTSSYHHLQRHIVDVYTCLFQSITVNSDLNNSVFLDYISDSAVILNDAMDVSILTLHVSQYLHGDKSRGKVNQKYIDSNCISETVHSFADVIGLYSSSSQETKDDKNSVLFTPFTLSSLMDMHNTLFIFAQYIGEQVNGAASTALNILFKHQSKREHVDNINVLSSMLPGLFVGVSLPSFLQQLVPLVFTPITFSKKKTSIVDQERISMFQSIVTSILSRLDHLHNHFPHLSNIVGKSHYSTSIDYSLDTSALEYTLAAEATALCIIITDMFNVLVKPSLSQLVLTTHSPSLSQFSTPLEVAGWLLMVASEHVSALHLVQNISGCCFANSIGLSNDGDNGKDTVYKYNLILPNQELTIRDYKNSLLHQLVTVLISDPNHPSFTTLTHSPVLHVSSKLTASVSSKLTSSVSFFEIESLPAALSMSLSTMIACRISSIQDLTSQQDDKTTSSKKKKTFSARRDHSISSILIDNASSADLVFSDMSLSTFSKDQIPHVIAELRSLLNQLERLTLFPHSIITSCLLHSDSTVLTPLMVKFVVLDAYLSSLSLDDPILLQIKTFLSQFISKHIVLPRSSVQKGLTFPFQPLPLLDISTKNTKSSTDVILDIWSGSNVRPILLQFILSSFGSIGIKSASCFFQYLLLRDAFPHLEFASVIKTVFTLRNEHVSSEKFKMEASAAVSTQTNNNLVLLLCDIVTAVLCLDDDEMFRQSVLLRILSHTLSLSFYHSADDYSDSPAAHFYSYLHSRLVSSGEEVSLSNVNYLTALLKVSHNMRATSFWIDRKLFKKHISSISSYITEVFEVFDKLPCYNYTSSVGGVLDTDLFSYSLDAISQYMLGPSLITTFADQPDVSSLSLEHQTLVKYMSNNVQIFMRLVVLHFTSLLALGAYHVITTRIQAIMTAYMPLFLSEPDFITVDGVEVYVGSNVSVYWLIQLLHTCVHNNHVSDVLFKYLRPQYPISSNEDDVTTNHPLFRPHVLNNTVTVVLMDLVVNIMNHSTTTSTVAIESEDSVLLDFINTSDIADKTSYAVFFNNIHLVISMLDSIATTSLSYVSDQHVTGLVLRVLNPSSNMIESLTSLIDSLVSTSSPPNLDLNSPTSSLTITPSSLLTQSSMFALNPISTTTQTIAASCLLTPVHTLTMITNIVTYYISNIANNKIHNDIFSLFQTLMQTFTINTNVSQNTSKLRTDTSETNRADSFITGTTLPVVQGDNTHSHIHLTHTVLASPNIVFRTNVSTSGDLSRVLLLSAVARLNYDNICTTLRNIIRNHDVTLRYYNTTLLVKHIRVLFRFFFNNNNFLVGQNNIGISNSNIYNIIKLLRNILTPYDKIHNKHYFIALSTFFCDIIFDYVQLMKSSLISIRYVQLIKPYISQMIGYVSPRQMKTLQLNQDEAGRHVLLQLASESKK